MAIEVFTLLEDALEYTAGNLIPDRHSFIINLIGPREQKRAAASTLQIVSEDMVFRNGLVGFTVHLPFDPASGEFQHLVQSIGTPLHFMATEYKYDGVPCFALRLGADTFLTERITRYTLRHVFAYFNLKVLPVRGLR